MNGFIVWIVYILGFIATYYSIRNIDKSSYWSWADVCFNLFLSCFSWVLFFLVWIVYLIILLIEDTKRYFPKDPPKWL